MNKGDLVNKIAGDAGLSKVQAGAALNSLIDGITGTLRKALALSPPLREGREQEETPKLARH